MEPLIKKYFTEPIRENIFILVVKIFLTMFLFNTVFFALELFVLRIDFPADYHSFITIALFFGHIVKSFLEIYFVINILLKWLGNVYFFDFADKKLVKREGLINTHEKIYDLKIIRSIEIEQDFIGRLFHYGNIIITTSASGGYSDRIYLNGIPHPEKNKEMLKECLRTIN